MSKDRLIKKYANRRLYDASISKHVTLEDIRDLIVRGEKIKVVEDKTGEDITRLILLQVIAEQEQFGKPILTTQLLESIIRYYGGPCRTLWPVTWSRAWQLSCASRKASSSRSRRC